MTHRTSALTLLLLAGMTLAQAPEPIDVLPRVIPTDVAGDPLPAGAKARMGTLRWRHGGAVHFVGFVADGQEVVSASLDGWIRVWEVSSGRELRRWRWHPGGPAEDDGLPDSAAGRPEAAAVRSIVLSPDRRFLAASLPDGKVRVWTIKGNEERTLGTGRFQDGSNGIAFSPDGRILATRGIDHVILLWDPRTGKQLGRLPPPADVGQRGNIFFYGRMGNTLAFSPDGKMLAAMNTWNTEDAKGFITLYEVETGKALRRIDGGERSLSGRLAFGPGMLAVAWGNRETRLYDPDTGKELRPLGEPQEGIIVHALAFSPDGQVVAARSGSSTPSITLYEAATGKKLRDLGELMVTEQENVFVRMSGPGSSSMTLDFSPDGKRIAEATGGRVVRVYDVSDAAQKR